MKVISGLYKGRNLKGFNIDGTRPTMDRVKESVFSMIQLQLKDAVILDLFSGSGNLAIEALSNYAKHATLVDNNSIAIKTINENISNLNINNATVIKNDAIKQLDELIINDISFDIIFLDPPYNTELLSIALNKINDNINILNEDAIIICETTKDIDYSTFSNFDLYKKRKYGDKKVDILKRK